MIKKVFLLFFIFLNICLRADSNKLHSPTKAIMLSGVLPGAGQYYNKKYIKSFSFFSVESISLGLSIFYNNKYRSTGSIKYLDRRNTFIPIFVISWVYSLLDAYVDAHFFLVDQKHLSLISKNDILYCSLNFKF